MEEEAAVKAAPVTRLRRRLSVETEEIKSPSTPSTPTKKRAGRLAAKPQLELIDEHAVTESPKRVTRKSISRDIAEPDERPVTPARRSTRTKSNTSLVSEVDEKPATPARRSTRIKSNTSIVSETVQTVDSPRAKRATARRNSQVGSDTEATVTPARTRRTRKASTSSIDKDETSVAGKGIRPNILQKTEVVVVTNDECNEWYESQGSKVKVAQTQMCAGHEQGGRDSCWADSGGPLMVHGDKGRATVIGVVSTGSGCARARMPGIYTRVSRYTQWIIENVKDGSRRLSWYPRSG